MINNIYYDEYFGGKQQVLSIFYEKIKLPQEDPIHTLKKVMEELDFSRLLAQYSVTGRKATNPIMLLGLLVYANMRGMLHRYIYGMLSARCAISCLIKSKTHKLTIRILKCTLFRKKLKLSTYVMRF